jgi:type II secretory pathway pseudopilin PulG
MKTQFFHVKPAPNGFSLVELSLVMATILSLAVFIGFGFNATRRWQQGKNASLALQAAYTAQRSYLADHPAADIATVAADAIRAYLPQGWNPMPAIAGLQDEVLSINYAVMPPVLGNGGSVYDPSGKSGDGLWDAGE